MPSLFCAALRAAFEVPGFLDADWRLEKNDEGFATTWFTLVFVFTTVAFELVGDLESDLGVAFPLFKDPVALMEEFVLGFDEEAVVAIFFAGCNDAELLSRCLFKLPVG